AKIDEQVERIVHLIALLGQDRIDWTPPAPGGWTAGVLLGHLLDCLAGFCAVFQAAEPERLAHFTHMRDLPGNQACSTVEAGHRVASYRAHIQEGFSLIDDRALTRSIPTVFVPQGEPLLTLLLGNLEHLINHKHQLFVYLRLMGVDVASRDLYRFRGMS